MLVVDGVMVELGIAAPKTGALIFLPMQSSGALAATKELDDWRALARSTDFPSD